MRNTKVWVTADSLFIYVLPWICTFFWVSIIPPVGMVPHPSSPRVGMSLLSSPVQFTVRSDDEKTIHELRDMLGTSMVIRERIEGDKLVKRVEERGRGGGEEGEEGERRERRRGGERGGGRGGGREEGGVS